MPSMPDAVPVLNTDTSAVPAFGLMAVTSIDSNGIRQIGKPTSDGQVCLLNGPVAISPSTYGTATANGQGTYNPRVLLAYDGQDGVPAAGETWGAASGQWTARKNKGGFVIEGGAGYGVVNAVRWQSQSSSVTSWKNVVRCATIVPGTLSTDYIVGAVVDDVTIALNDPILIKNQASGGENGIRLAQTVGPPLRRSDCDTGDELVGATVFVSEGTVNRDTIWACITDAPIVIDSTATVWVRIYPTGPFEARLVSVSGGKWKFNRLTLDTSGAWVDDGSTTADYCAVPSTIDGTNLCNPVAGLRVTMTQSKTYDASGKPLFEFLPTGYASATNPGIVSITTQQFAGNKEFLGDVAVDGNLEVTGNQHDTGWIKSNQYMQATYLLAVDALSIYNHGSVTAASNTKPNINSNATFSLSSISYNCVTNYPWLNNTGASFGTDSITLTAGDPIPGSGLGYASVTLTATGSIYGGIADLWILPNNGYLNTPGYNYGRLVVAGDYAVVYQQGVWTGLTYVRRYTDTGGSLRIARYIGGICVCDSLESDTTTCFPPACSWTPTSYDCIDGTCLPSAGTGTYANLSACLASGCGPTPTTTTTTTTSTTTTLAPNFCCSPGPTGDLCASFSMVTGLSGMPAGLTFTRSTYACGGGTCVIWSSAAWCGMPAGSLVFRCGSGPIDPTMSYGFGYDPAHIASAAAGYVSGACSPFIWVFDITVHGMGSCGSGSFRISLAEGACSATTTTTTSTTTTSTTTTSTTTTAAPCAGTPMTPGASCAGAPTLSLGAPFKPSGVGWVRFAVSTGTAYKVELATNGSATSGTLFDDNGGGCGGIVSGTSITSSGTPCTNITTGGGTTFLYVNLTDIGNGSCPLIAITAGTC